MKIFISGGSGFVGQEIIHQLDRQGYQIRALAHRNNSSFGEHIETFPGDTTDLSTLGRALSGCDAIIHLVGIIREIPSRGITFEKLHCESTKNLIQAARAQGVTRFLHMSANGVRTDARTAYHQTKWAAETALRESSLDWTIFRPSLIFGPGDQFINMLAKLIRLLPLVPVMGDGRYRLQPVAVQDVAAGFVESLQVEKSIGQTYLCGGPEQFSYDELLDQIGLAIGKSPVKKLHHPLCLMKPVVAVMQSFPQFPMTSDQLQMLLEGNVCDPTPWRDTFHLQLTHLSDGIKTYLK